jgi:cupin fold WbuC family metalloprotein
MGLKTFTLSDLKALDDHAATLPRLRTHLNLHDPAHDPIQRFVIHMRHGTYVRPHRHIQQKRWECVVFLAGSADLLLFDDHGTVIDRVRAGEFDEVRVVEIPPDRWHSYYVVTASATFFEVKEGPYDARLDKTFADWAPPEGDALAPAFVNWLERAAPGRQWLRSV